MSDRWDSAVVDSFFATLETEAFRALVPEAHDTTTRAVGQYIDDCYDPKQGRSFFDYECPIGFELSSRLAATAA